MWTIFGELGKIKGTERDGERSMIHLFIVNSKAGVGGVSRRLHEQLKKIEGIRYYVFHTSSNKHADQLVEEILPFFEGEDELRFYACGGSGTMQSMLNGFKSFDNVEIAFFPYGLTNDFMKMFGNDISAFQEIKNLIEGDVVKVDYIKTNHGIALNTVSTGIDADVCRKMAEYSNLGVFGSQVPYLLGMLYGIFAGKPKEYEYSFDGQLQTRQVSEIIFGNGQVLGGSLHFGSTANFRDGIASTCLIPKNRGFGLLPVLMALSSNKRKMIQKLCTLENASKFTVRTTDGSNIYMNLDGEIVDKYNDWEAEIVKQGLSFVVPKGVSIHE